VFLFYAVIIWLNSDRGCAVLDIALVVGQNIARLRHERGWTLQDLASYLDTNAQNVSGIEKGRRGIQEVVSSILISSTIKNKGLGDMPSPFCFSE
jgi:transcriptional regulator